MKKTTLAALVAVLLVLIGAAVVVGRSGRPAPSEMSPLATLPIDQITQLELSVNGATTTIKDVNGDWRIVTPFEDRAFREAVVRLLTFLKDIRLGSVVSENPARFVQFALDDAQATRFKVFAKGQETPVLDYWVGKEATDPTSCFIRVPGSNQVRTAENLPVSALLKSPELFRSPVVPPFEPQDITAISAKGPVDVTIVETTGTWHNKATGRILPDDLRQEIGRGLSGWRTDVFTISQPSGQGFEKPYFTLELSRGGTNATVIVGGPAADQPKPSRYVRCSDRPAILVVDDVLTQAVIDRLKKAE